MPHLYDAKNAILVDAVHFVDISREMPLVKDSRLETLKHPFDDFFAIIFEKNSEKFPVIRDKNKGAQEDNLEAGIILEKLFDSSGVVF